MNFEQSAAEKVGSWRDLNSFVVGLLVKIDYNKKEVLNILVLKPQRKRSPTDISL